MAVTADKYELPLIVEDSSAKLAAKIGIRQCTVVSTINRNQTTGRNSGRKLIKVLFSDDEWEEEENE